MTVKKSLTGSRGFATKPELFFMERGAEAHEFYLVRANALRPQRYGYVLVGELQDENEYDEFIQYCEGSFQGRMRTSEVRYSWSNWKRYERKKRKAGPGASHRR